MFCCKEEDDDEAEGFWVATRFDCFDTAAGVALLKTSSLEVEDFVDGAGFCAVDCFVFLISFC